jgi:hypothetical protein
MGMDMKKYMGSSFLKPEDVRDNSRQVQIVDVTIGDFDKPVVHFDSGEKLSLNTTNAKLLGRTYGTDSDSWLNQTVELYVGQTEFKGEPQDSVLVGPISPEKRRPPAPDRDLDYETGF